MKCDVHSGYTCLLRNKDNFCFFFTIAPRKLHKKDNKYMLITVLFAKHLLMFYFWDNMDKPVPQRQNAVVGLYRATLC